jgi:hypothetical protein
MRYVFATIVLGVALGCVERGAGTSSAKLSAAGLPLAELKIKGHALVIEVAATNDDRVRGYRFRAKIPDGTGMLFIFPVAHFPRFVMGGVTVPLSIAFIGEDGRICEMCDMPLSPDDVTAGAYKVTYALEAPLGWYARNKIGVGDQLEGLQDIVRRFPAR